MGVDPPPVPGVRRSRSVILGIFSHRGDRTMEFIRYEKKGRVAYVTINRPEVMNALHPPANHELSQAFDDFAADPDMWVAIVTGAGEKAFSAGNDLKYSAQHGVGGMTLGKGGFGGLTARFDLFKPIIA